MAKSTMKAVILAGGRGVELLPLTATRPKPMIPLLGKPILQYLIEELKSVGLTDILIVTGYKGEHIHSYFKRGTDFGVNIEYVDQGQKEGIEAAIGSILEYVQNESEFLMLFGDIIAEKGLIQRALNAFENTQADMAMTLTLQGNTGDFGIVELDSTGFVKRVGLSKAKGPQRGNYIDAGCFVLRPEIVERIKKAQSLIEAINVSIKNGMRVVGAIWEKEWFDIGKPWNVLQANQMLLSKIEASKIAKTAVIESNVVLKNTVIIEDGAIISSGTVLNGPVYIGPNTYIGNNVLIREYSSIGANSLIGFGSEIKNSVLLSNVKAYRLCYIGDSIVGANTVISSGVMTVNTETPKREITMNINGRQVNTGMMKLGAIIGDNCEIGVNSLIFPGRKIAANKVITPGSQVKSDTE